MKKLMPVRLGLSILSLARRAVAFGVGGSILLVVQQASACPFCYGAKDGKSTQHMAVAIWFLFGAVMSVIGGIGAFSFKIWRHGRMPLEPHQEINEEDLDKFDE
jgi:hypothetical protein